VTDSVADASAILTLIRGEPGALDVQRALADGRVFVSTVNVTEVVTKLLDWGMDEADAVEALQELKLISVEYSETTALRAATLRSDTRSLGLSTGDRACLALGLELDLRILTADRSWARVALRVPITVIR